ncbi:uncharacterized protein LOC111401241 [Olea europaea subsp. europaea]|uniref:Uncharacterized protein LOC111401241 n=1 Tax=Olea europaea subsp. europaea TaxID=158383 RepID=A0A8S0RBR4_OLEEU|nr:uncharacterized protein LOC111401241 [Olea europaea subsp. europaea]
MQIIGFSMRLSSSLLWIQMYRMGASYIDNSAPRETDVDLRNSFLNPATPIVRRPSDSDDVIGGAIYDPAYFSSLFEDGRDDASLLGGGQNHGIATLESPSSAETSRLNPSMSRSYRIEDGDNAARKLQIV